MKYTKVKTIRISEQQHKTLVKMKSYNVDVGCFIRQAIKEKINRDKKHLLPKKEVVYCPFSNGTIKLT
jgi:predicted CopG family antitoxin